MRPSRASPAAETETSKPALAAAGGLDDPALAGLSEPQKYVRAENLRQRVQTAQDTAETEVGKALGVEIGFNSADGD